MSTPRFLAAGTFTVLAALSPLLPDASADVVTAYWNSSTNFGYEISNMPDLDQRRSPASGIIGLPGGGNMHCVPTASMNMVLYAGNHGFPEVNPGPGNWQSQANYNLLSLELLVMGLEMNTSPTDGTGGAGWLQGVKSRFDPSEKFVVSQYTADGFYSPSLASMTASALNGSIVSFAYGRYDVVGYDNGIPMLSRDGGHVVTMTKSIASGPFGLLWCRDPAAPNDGLVTTQSPFENRLLVITPLLVKVGSQFRVMSAVNYTQGSDRIAFIDQYVGVRPKAAYSWQNQPEAAIIKIYQPFSFSDPEPALNEFQIDVPLTSIVADPDQTSIVGLTEGTSPSLQVIDLLTQQPAASIPMPEFSDDILISGRRNIYVSNGTNLYCFDESILHPIEFEPPIPTPNFLVDLPFDPDAIAFNELTEEVVAVSLEAQKLARIDGGLQGSWQVNDIAVPSGGRASLAVHTSGAMMITSDEADAAYLVSPFGDVPTVTPLTHPKLVRPTSVQFDDSGDLYFNVEMTNEAGDVATQMIALRLAAGPVTTGFPTTILVESDVNLFEGVEFGPVSRVLQSRDNFDPDTMDGPAWKHLFEDELAGFADTLFESFCSGDGGNQLGCTDCPCGNNAPEGSYGGCLNESGQSAELLSFGSPSVSDDQMRFEMRQGNPGTFGVLISGEQRAPANASNPCFGLASGIQSSVFNGLRCVVQGVQRHGARATDGNGDIGATNNGWGGMSGPANGLIDQGGFVAGQRRHFQIIYRENSSGECLANQNTTQAVTTTFLP